MAVHAMTQARNFALADPWQVREEDFPQNGSHEEKLSYLLNYAVLAPSILNSQPWRFQFVDEALFLMAEPSRLLPVTDSCGREMTISCGAALENLKTAAHGFNHQIVLDLLPDADNEDILAKIVLTQATKPANKERRAFAAITRRRTHRGKFDLRHLSKRLTDSLTAAARREGAVLSLSHESDVRRRVEELVAEGRHRQLSDPAYREELAKWIKAREHEGLKLSAEANWRTGNDGTNVAGQTPELRPQADLFVPTATQVARMFESPQREKDVAGDNGNSGPVLALLTTEGDTRKDWLTVGQALQAVLLRAAAYNVFASYLSPPIEVPELRQDIAEAFHAEGYPQVLMKLGHAAARTPVARRPVTEVLH